MKNKLYIALLILMVSLPAAAQNNPERQSELKGEELMRQAAAKLKSYDAVKINFTFKMENESQDIEEEMKGILISKGEKYYLESGEYISMTDGVTTWTYMPDIGEVHINLLENTEGSLTPTAILQNFEKDFRSKFIRQENYQGKQVNLIDLVPNQSMAFFKFRIALDPSGMIVYSTAYDRQGGTYTYSVDSIEENPKVAAGQFTFDVKDHPGVEVVDLR